MSRILFVVALVTSFLGISAPAQAEWRVAESDRFVIYSESRTEDLTRFAQKLEQFHAALELATGRKLPVPSPSNRVTVFVVGTLTELKEVYGSRRSGVAGFYIPRASGSVAFVPAVRIGGGASNRRSFSRMSSGADSTDFETVVLLHEYAHHFLISTSRFGMPRWLSEGAAEFYGSAQFMSDGSMQIGMPADHRAWELNSATIAVEDLLDPANENVRRYGAFYGRSWLLFHYLAFSEERSGQLQRYWSALQQGTPSIEAAKAIFGDLDTLRKELEDYNKLRRLPTLSWSSGNTPVGNVTVRDLSDGMDAMVPLMMLQKRGVEKEEAVDLLTKVRSVATKYPDDAGVLAALAEAEYDAGNDAEAIAAADRALAINSGEKNAYIQKGYALFRMAEEAEDQDAAYASALEPFFALNGIENDHPLPLIYYYRSFQKRELAPPADARGALERAAVLAPFDESVSMDAGMMLASEGKIQLALYMLGPVASDPHGGEHSAYAQALVSAIEGTPEGSPFDVSSVPKPEPEEDEGEDGDSDDSKETAA